MWGFAPCPLPLNFSLIHISPPTSLYLLSYAVSFMKKKKQFLLFTPPFFIFHPSSSITPSPSSSSSPSSSALSPSLPCDSSLSLGEGNVTQRP